MHLSPEKFKQKNQKLISIVLLFTKEESGPKASKLRMRVPLITYQTCKNQVEPNFECP